MCSYGDTKDEKIGIYLGYYGCTFKLNNSIYAPQNDKYIDRDCKKISKDEIIKLIKENYNYDEFINAILECVENGEEI